MDQSVHTSTLYREVSWPLRP